QPETRGGALAERLRFGVIAKWLFLYSAEAKASSSWDSQGASCASAVGSPGAASAWAMDKAAARSLVWSPTNRSLPESSGSAKFFAPQTVVLAAAPPSLMVVS